MIIIIGLIVWLLCGLFAVYKTIKDDSDGAKIEVNADAFGFIKFCMVLIIGGILSLIIVYLIEVEESGSLNKLLIKMIDKIGDTQDE